MQQIGYMNVKVKTVCSLLIRSTHAFSKQVKLRMLCCNNFVGKFQYRGICYNFSKSNFKY